MNIRYFLRGPVWWLDVREGGLRKKVSTGVLTEAEAHRVGPELALKAIVALRAGKQSSSVDGSQAGKPKWTLKTAFLHTKKVRRQWLQSGDPGSLENTYNVLADEFGEDFPLEKFDFDFVLEVRTRWLATPGKKRGTTLSASTINGRLSMLSVLQEECRMRGHGVKHLTTKGNDRKRRVNQDEIRKMQAWLLANHHRKGALVLHDMITVALDTGARAGELTDLPQGDIRMDDKTITLRDTKNGDTRVVPFNEASKRIFEARRDAPVGPFAELNKSQRSALIRDMRVGLGLEDDEELVFHILRHEAASRLIAAGNPASVVQHIMGHANFATTERYVKVSLESMREAQQQRQNYEALKELPTSGTVQ